MFYLDIIAHCIISLVLLFFIEGVITLGEAFKFSNYNAFCWIVQIMLIFLAIWIGIKLSLN
jgi:phosphoketolase